MQFKFKVEMKLCPKCYMPAYSALIGETGRVLHYCQNVFCMNMGKNIDDLYELNQKKYSS